MIRRAHGRATAGSRGIHPFGSQVFTSLHACAPGPPKKAAACTGVSCKANLPKSMCHVMWLWSAQCSHRYESRTMHIQDDAADASLASLAAGRVENSAPTPCVAHRMHHAEPGAPFASSVRGYAPHPRRLPHTFLVFQLVATTSQVRAWRQLNCARCARPLAAAHVTRGRSRCAGRPS
jgi:hypothetical protein